MPQTLIDALDQFAAQAGLRSATQILACARREHLQLVGAAPRRRQPSPPREIRRYWIEK